ncbi:hypothetical protein ACWEWX_04780 [Streptomyces asiaticus]
MTTPNSNTPPLSPERETEIREYAAAAKPGHNAIRDVLAELDCLKQQYKAGLRRADELNNALMGEVQRYAEGTERPVLWSVYNRMHHRALNAEAERDRATRAFEALAAKHDKAKAERDELREQLLTAQGDIALEASRADKAETERDELTKHASRLAAVEYMVERAYRKGYDPDVHDLAEALGITEDDVR